MRQYTIATTMKHDAGDGKGEQTYGTEVQVEGPDTLEEFQTALGINGVLQVLSDAFESDQVSILRGRLARKLGKEKAQGGGRIANAVRVDLED
jgi:hypothetical protein